MTLLLFLFAIINSEVGEKQPFDLHEAQHKRVLAAWPILKANIPQYVFAEPFDELDPKINMQIDQAFAPVYARIPHFADKHYSVLGEYIELGQAATNQIERSLQQELFTGLDARLNVASTNIAFAFNGIVKQRIQTLSNELAIEGIDVQRLQQLSTEYLNHVLKMREVAQQIGVAAGVGGVGALSALLSVKLMAKLSAKMAGKVALSAGGGASAAVGATIGSVVPGVGTVIGGIIGGVIGWLATDAIVVSVDEWFNREDFEKELRQMVTDQREQVKQSFKKKIEQMRRTFYEKAKSVSDKTPAELQHVK